jgi:glycosyltransferase involved in cell wall biosynthesis
MRVLVLIGDRPVPAITATRVRNLHLWPAMKRLGVELKVLGLDLTPGAEAPPAIEGVEVEYIVPARRPLPARAWAAWSRSYHQWPYSAALARRVDEVAASWRPDVIHAEELRMASYLPCMRGLRSTARQSATLHNVESVLYESIANPAVPFGRGLAKRLHLHSLRGYESRVAARVDLKLAYSELDRDRYARLYPAPGWSATRNGADVIGQTPAPQPEEPAILLVGSLSYAPNTRGLSWFLEEVVPRLRHKAAVTVAGSGASPALRQRLAEADGVRFVDTPPELKPLYDEHALLAVPLLEGSGTRGKILEALAYERLVVTTTKGVEGLDLHPGEGIMIADGPEAFARALDEALGSLETRASLARRGRQAVLERYDWTVVAADLKRQWEACLAS